MARDKVIFQRKSAWLTLLILAVAILAAYAGFRHFARQEIRSSLDQLVEMAAGRMRIQYGDVGIKLFTREVRVQNIRITPLNSSHASTIDLVTVRDIDRDHFPPYFMDVAFKGLSVSSGTVPDLWRALHLDKMGYDKIEGDLGLNYHFSESESTLDIRQLQIQAGDMGRIALAAKLKPIPFDLLTGPDGALLLLFSLPGAYLDEFRARFEDRGLTRRIMADRADAARLTEPAYRKKLLGHVTREIRKAGDDQTRAALTELGRFLADPAEITITAEPDEPRLLGELRIKTKPVDWIAVFSVRVQSGGNTKGEMLNP